jgi:DNA-directed RNA polymerase subunit RPC12/RpoP
MAGLLNYECPCCGGKIEFDSTTQHMKCPYCDTEFEAEALKSFDDELKQTPPDDMKWDTKAGTEWQEGEQDNMKTYFCESCGGEIVTDMTTSASACPYCDNPIIMKGQLAGELRPDYVIPFKLDKKAAKEALSNHFKGKPLLPKLFKDENHIDEIKGVYVPVWLFDADVNARIRYKGEKIRHWEDRNYRYTEISYFALFRGGSIAFRQVPVDGSEKMDDTMMESIEPFHFKDAVDFQTAYLSGYLADKYDVDAETSIHRANQRIRQSTVDAFERTTSGYHNVHTAESSIQLSGGKAKYALYPVWLLNTTWNGKKFTFAMNGQTGKFVGDLPADKSAAFRWFGSIAGIAAAVTFALTFLFWLL